MAKAAIIDIGTNTFHLLIVEIEEKSYSIIHREKSPVKLGRGGMQQKMITEDAQNRALQALSDFAKTCTNVGLSNERIYAFATSAVRSSSNGQTFVQKVKNNTGINIEVIDGDREAELIFKGVKSFVHLGSDSVLTIDIGGGSTEFIIGNNCHIQWKKSFNLGVARMKETFNGSDPLTPQQTDTILSTLNNELHPLWEAIDQWKPNSLIGSSGTFESLATILSLRSGKEPDFQNPSTFEVTRYQSLHQELLNSTLEERLKIRGLAPMRAEYIVFGSLLIQIVLSKLACSTITYSDYALKEGFLAEITQKA